MAVFHSEYLILGFFVSLIEDVLCDDTCSHGCGAYTCYTICENGCCGTYNDRYCCSAYSSVAVVVGGVIGGLVLLAVVIGVIAFCVMAVQKKKRMVRPRMVQPTTHTNFTANDRSNRSHRTTRPTATVPPYNQNSQQLDVSPYNCSIHSFGAPPYPVGDPPPSYNDIYPQSNASDPAEFNNQRRLPSSVPSQQVTTNIQTSQQYGQLQLPNSPPPPY